MGALPADELERDPDRALASLRPWLIRPRALTLMLWTRLLVCDLFIHGIGGAKYDRITDRIIRWYYRAAPPAFACVSATLRLPLPHPDVSERDLAAAIRRARDIRFNPQRYLATAPGPRLAERTRLIEESRRLRAARAPRPSRRRAFLGIRRANAALIESEPAVEQSLRERVSHLSRELQSKQVSEGREYFYALQPRGRLMTLAERLADAITG